MSDVGMPRLSDTMREAAISQWLVDDGATVIRGQEILEVETEKATMTYEAEQDGVLRILVREGTSVAVGEPIATIGGSDEAHPGEGVAAESAPAVGGPNGRPNQPATSVSTAPVPHVSGSTESGRSRVRASPLVRRLAQESGVDLQQVQGSGPDGQILREDIEAAGKRPSAVPPPVDVADVLATGRTSEQRQPLSRRQLLVAKRVSAVSAAVPDFWASISVDVTDALAIRDERKVAAEPEPDGPVPTITHWVVKACAVALRRHPRLNSTLQSNEVVISDEVNIGLAVAAHGELSIPVLHHADRLTINEIASRARLLADQVRNGSIGVDDLHGGTFTVSSLGGHGVRAFAPIIYGDQVAILGVGAAISMYVPPDPVRAVDVEHTSPVVRSLLELTLTCDHRVIYGADAAAFLGTVKALLETPRQLESS